MCFKKLLTLKFLKLKGRKDVAEPSALSTGEHSTHASVGMGEPTSLPIAKQSAPGSFTSLPSATTGEQGPTERFKTIRKNRRTTCVQINNPNLIEWSLNQWQYYDQVNI